MNLLLLASNTAQPNAVALIFGRHSTKSGYMRNNVEKIHLWFLSSQPSDMDRADRPSSQIVVAIDFGTTYSGIAFSTTQGGQLDEIDPSILASDIRVERQWPNPTLSYLDKTPTVLSYCTTPPKWGGAVRQKSDKPYISHFKLGLEPSVPELYGYQALPNTYGFGKHPDLPDKDPVDFTMDFFFSLVKHLRKECLPRELAQEFLERQRFTYVITVPAIWSPGARGLTRRAAAAALGEPEDKLILVPEPEAAALFCATMCHEVNLKDGDGLLVCDAGGGTVVRFASKATVY